MSSGWRALLALVVSGCVWTGGGSGAAEVVRDKEVLAFATRIERFYGALEGRAVPVMATFEDPALHVFFAEQSEFSDYYAALADDLRRAGFRNGRPERVEIREFRFEGSDRAVVDVAFVGRHMRGLRFWEIRVRRLDPWRLDGGTWVVSPAML